MRHRRTIKSTVRISKNRCLDTVSDKMYPFKLDKRKDFTCRNTLVYQKRYVDGGYNYKCCNIRRSSLSRNRERRSIVTIELSPEGRLYNILLAFKVRRNFEAGYTNKSGIITRIVHIMDSFYKESLRRYSGKFYFDPDIAVDTFDQKLDDDNDSCSYYEEGIVNE